MIASPGHQPSGPCRPSNHQIIQQYYWHTSGRRAQPCSLCRSPGSRIEGHQPSVPNPPQADVHIPHDTEYWDDVNSYSTRQEWLQKPIPIIAETLQLWSLMVNTLKTVSFTVSTTDEDWRSVEQLESLMGTPEDNRRRMQQTAIAFRRMYGLWLRKYHVSIDGRVCFYKAFVLLALLYYCCTRGATKACMDRLDDFHRRQLRSLNGHYELASPSKNQIVYNECHQRERQVNQSHVWEATILTAHRKKLANAYVQPSSVVLFALV